MLWVLLLLGYQEPEVVTMEVRDFFRVELKGAAMLAGSRRVLMLTDHEDYAKSRNRVLVSLDDVGLLAPLGCTIEVRGEKRAVSTVGFGELNLVVITRREDVRIKGVAAVVVPEYTAVDRAEQKMVERMRANARVKGPGNGQLGAVGGVGGVKPQPRVGGPAPKKGTGVVLPGGQP